MAHASKCVKAHNYDKVPPWMSLLEVEARRQTSRTLAAVC